MGSTLKGITVNALQGHRHKPLIPVSLKFRYAGAAFMGVVLAAFVLVLLFAWQQRFESRRLGALAQSATRERTALELDARALETARHVAESAAAALQSANAPTDLAQRLQPFLDDDTLAAVLIRDTAGQTLYHWQRAARPAQGALQSEAIQQIRAQRDSGADAGTPRTLGEAQVLLTQAAPEPVGAIGRRMSAISREDFRTVLLLAGALAAGAGLVGAGLAWRAGRRLEQPISALIKSAERIGQGDYTRPLDVARRDELGELQQALERMRDKLHQTTITKDYLNSVLNGMTDAVFVTSPDGVIRIANQAACSLLGYGEEEILGTSITAMLDEREREGFDLQQAAHDSRETVVRTRQGQTIPVSLTGSQIAGGDTQFQGSIFVVRNITDRKRAERRIRYLARYDALTKVPNRMQFQHLLQQAIARGIRSSQAVALLYFDIDRFKEVNDTFGHGAGDRILEVLAERLTRALPKDTVVGRLAGDEFALFVEGLPADADNRGPIAHLARSILTEISRAFQLNQQEIFLTASVGIAFCPRDAENVIDLIRNADAAMYHSKQNGGNSCAFYVPSMNAAAVERLMLKSKLRRALERDELVILYQSKVDLRTGRVVGAEALLRWRLPGYGDISPSHFIPLAEETSLILDIGEWVLNRVCSDYREWQKVVPHPGRIAINLSLRQLKQPSFISRCRSVFRKHGVSPTYFELEVTETTLMTDPKRTIGLLNELYAMGLSLAIDDFGTGYSSLSALQQFPIGTLKIDQSFVRDVAVDTNDAAIVRTIIDMGKSLDLEVIAEGVEEAEQLEFLRTHGCYYAQGRLFGDAMEANKLLGILAGQEGGTPHHGNLCAPTVLRPVRLSQ